MAERFLDDLLAAVEQYPDPVAVEAAAVFCKNRTNWETNTGSKGAVLFADGLISLGMTCIPFPGVSRIQLQRPMD